MSVGAGPRECLVLGVEGAGKSLLLRRLWEVCCGGPSELLNDSISPTVGQDVIAVKGRKESSVSIREIGGRMGSAWMSYTDLCSSVILMIDIADPGVLSASAVLLQELLVQLHAGEKRILLLLNKRDLIEDVHLRIAINLLRIKDFPLLYPEMKVDSLIGSLYDLHFVHAIYSWIATWNE